MLLAAVATALAVAALRNIRASLRPVRRGRRIAPCDRSAARTDLPGRLRQRGVGPRDLSPGGARTGQRRFGGFGGRDTAVGEPLPNIPYDGRFTFVRVNYETAPGGYWYRGLPSWAHGYPVAERNLMRIMNELSFLHAHDEAVNTLALDDPRLFDYPVAYIIEVSWWTMTDRQGGGAARLHEEGRLRDRRRLQGRRGFRQRRLGAVRGQHAARRCPARSSSR